MEVRNLESHVHTASWPENPFFDVNLFEGKFITVACMFRGDWKNELCDRKITELQHNSNYVTFFCKKFLIPSFSELKKSRSNLHQGAS